MSRQPMTAIPILMDYLPTPMPRVLDIAEQFLPWVMVTCQPSIATWADGGLGKLPALGILANFNMSIPTVRTGLQAPLHGLFLPYERLRGAVNCPAEASSRIR